jgi:hypothetical protein
MHKLLIILIILIKLNFIALSQDLDEAKNIIKQLSSKQFYGRGYRFGGDSITANYIKNYFQKLNLKPLFNNNYFQHFKINVNTFPEVPTVKLDNQQLTLFKDYTFFSATNTINGNIN